MDMKSSLDGEATLAIDARAARKVAIGASVATLLLIAIVASGAVALGAPSVWTWQYLPLGAPLRVLFGIVPLLAVALILRGPGRALLESDCPTRRQEIGALTALSVAAFVSANAIILMHPLGWAYPTTLVVNPAANSYFSVALHHLDLAALLRDYPREMTGFASHAQTQSAGPVVFSGVAAHLAKASPLTPALADTLLALSPGTNPDELVGFCRRWEPPISATDIRAALCVALLMMAIGSLSVVPLYFAGKWAGAPGAGVFAALGFVLLPSFSLFSVSVDQMYPLFTATALCAVWRGVQAWTIPTSEAASSRRALLPFALAGIGLGGGLFFNMGLIVAVALCACFALFAARTQGVSPRQLVQSAAVFVAGLLIVPLLLRVAFGYDLWAVFLTSNHLRDSLYYNARSYSHSLWSNPLDFLAFCGLPVVILAAWRGFGASQRGLASLESALMIAFLITVFLLDISGRVRGEAARMTMFLMPPILIGAGLMWFAVWRTSRPLAALLIALQAAQLVAFQYFVRVWGY